MFYFIFLNFIKKFIFRTQIFEKAFLFFILLYIYIYMRNLIMVIQTSIIYVHQSPWYHHFSKSTLYWLSTWRWRKRCDVDWFCFLFFQHACSSKSIDALEFHSLYFIYFVLLITSYSNKHIAIAFNGVGQDSNSIKIHIQCLY